MEVYGWGRYPRAEARVFEPRDCAALAGCVAGLGPGERLVLRGNGRSYGDSALPAAAGGRIADSRHWDWFIRFDESTGILRCGAGLRLEEILWVIAGRGWFLPVLPGTRFVSVGGAVAADVHGKNHHGAGSFCDHIEELRLLLASGEVVTCSPTVNTPLFRATCGGMGLTGAILDATIRLKRISSTRIRQTRHIGADLRHSLELIDRHDGSEYSVAWVDCLARGPKLGRSVLFLGEHERDEHERDEHEADEDSRQSADSDSEAASKHLVYTPRRGPTVPLDMPGFMLNRYTMSAFNNLWFRLKQIGSKKGGSGKEDRLQADAYFFPLDSIRNWNRLYGRRGFLQYQFVLPLEAGLNGMGEVLGRVADSGKGSFLTVLKRFGPQNENFLSFPKAGYTLTLDFKMEDSLLPLLDELDAIVLAHGGRHYLAKDARMPEHVFKRGYPHWERFLAVKDEVDPQGKFASMQSARLGLTSRPASRPT